MKVELLAGQPKHEELSVEGAVYSTTVTTYDARDRATGVRVYQGQESSGVFREALMTYDGHGRLESSKAPDQTRPVRYAYHADDTVWKVLTPREAAGGTAQDVAATFTYNGRHMLRPAEYTVPAGLAGVPAGDAV